MREVWTEQGERGGGTYKTGGNKRDGRRRTHGYRGRRCKCGRPRWCLQAVGPASSAFLHHQPDVSSGDGDVDVGVCCRHYLVAEGPTTLWRRAPSAARCGCTKGGGPSPSVRPPTQSWAVHGSLMVSILFPHPHCRKKVGEASKAPDV